ncbi:MAG TPA: laminin G domain-containing protein [Cytophagaceae bacterium]|nr:laminin G domain-containing protein [Cytophagaceae bacterium]
MNFHFKTIAFLGLSLLAPLLGQAQTVIHSYPFNGNANDAVGTDNGTTSSVTLTQDRLGNANSAYHFSGSPSRITLDSHIDFGQDNFTVSAWFKTSSTDDSRGIHIFSNGGAYYGNGIQMGLNYPGYSQKVFFLMGGGGTQGASAQIITTASFADGQWHHYFVKVNRVERIIQLFVDDVQRDITQVSGSGGTIVGKDLDISCLNSLSGSSITDNVIGDYSYGYHTFIGDLDDLEFSTFSSSTTTTSCAASATYLFEGNADDAAGTNNGTVNGATLTQDRFGNTNAAYHFTGTDPSRITLAITLTSAHKALQYLPGSKPAAQTIIAASIFSPMAEHIMEMDFNWD